MSRRTARPSHALAAVARLALAGAAPTALARQDLDDGPNHLRHGGGDGPNHR